MVVQERITKIPHIVSILSIILNFNKKSCILLNEITLLNFIAVKSERKLKSLQILC